MALYGIPVDGCWSAAMEEQSDLRPTKRRRLNKLEHDEELLVSLPPHPLGVKPSGNAYAAEVNLKNAMGLFTLLPDELLLQLLEYLTAPSLIRLGSTCKALFAFTRSDDLWKTLFIQTPQLDFTWYGTWRMTYLSLLPEHIARVRCDNLFSDVLYRPFQCSFTSLKPYSSHIPGSNRIPRLTDLDYDEYSSRWINEPFILTEPVKTWPIFQKWTTASLLERYGDVKFRAECVDWPLETYVSYMQNTSDESPLYLFDRAFIQKMELDPQIDSDDASYKPPPCFGEDLFAVFGTQRPDNRWLIMGPARSGSTFHKDPNATSAWNAVISGSKYWLMFPSSANLPPPPGVIISTDGSEITSPLSIAEYLLAFHALARATPGCREGVCSAGEVLHVPSGWFHLVLNLEPGIAVTQNFVPQKRLVDVMQFLRDTPDQVSGFRDDVADPYGLFVKKLRENVPELLEDALATLEKRDQIRSRAKWEDLTKDATGNSYFSFGFGDGDDEEIP